MNLADAIRRAALLRQDGPQSPPPVGDSPVPAAFSPPGDSTAQSAPVTGDFHDPETTMEHQSEHETFASAMTQAAPTSPPEFPAAAVAGGNVVRLELFLTPEQMNAMLRAVMAGYHSVMTLREAAHYLRMNPSKLEKLAQEHQVPAFMIEGRWRFPKPALDEWLAVSAMKGTEEDHAA
ncbi:MAG TPA: helix-turn-helix domain-containing protein [Fimbriimonadaceae bacterium]|nr:helix-turn-helix domain-containing protein [Fimbriimonadaceae bacterium]